MIFRDVRAVSPESMCDTSGECCVEKISEPLVSPVNRFKCYKCKNAPATVGGRDKACQACFLTVTENHFKSILMTHLKIDRSTKAGLCFDLSTPAVVLENLFTCAMRGKNPRINPHENAQFLHVDVRKALKNFSTRENLDHSAGVSFLSELAASRGCPLHIIPFASSFEGVSSPTEIAAAVDSLAASHPDLASHAVHMIVQRDLLFKAKQLGIDALVMASTSDRLAVRTVQFACQGGGIHMPDECGPEDMRGSKLFGIRIVRPLHNMFAKDIALYHHFSQLPTPPKSVSVATPFSPVAGAVVAVAGRGFQGRMQRDKPVPSSICVDFLMGLQQAQGATSQVVTRTVAKLAPVRVPTQVTRDEVKLADLTTIGNIEHTAAAAPAAAASAVVVSLNPAAFIGSQLVPGGSSGAGRLWGGWCGLCRGRKEEGLLDRTRWSQKQKEFLLMLGGNRDRAMCMMCLRWASQSAATVELANLMFDVPSATLKAEA